MKKIYSASTGSDGKPYVEGPGNGTGYHHGLLWPEMRLSSAEDAVAAAKIANEAYQMGYLQAQFEVRVALGIKG